MGISETGVGEQVPFPLPSSKYCHEEQLPYDVVLFSGLPQFCSLVCIQYNVQKRKGSEKCGRPRNTYHMNDVWWMRGGCRGDIAHLQTHVINNRASFLQVKLSTVDLVNIWDPGYHWSTRWWSPVRYLNVGPSLLRSPHIHQKNCNSTHWWSTRCHSHDRPVFPGLPHFSPLFHFHTLYWTQTEE